MPRIGYLDPGQSTERRAEYDALRAELAKYLGQEGRDFVCTRYDDEQRRKLEPPGDLEDLVARSDCGDSAETEAAEPPRDLKYLAAWAVHEGADVLVPFGTDAVKAAAAVVEQLDPSSRRPVPIVMASTSDPSAIGSRCNGRARVESPERPGGNITGLTSLAPQLTAKRLEILREAFPSNSRVMFLRSTGSGDDEEQLRFEAAASRLQITPIVKLAANPEQLPALFQQAVQQGADALLAAAASFILKNSTPVVGLAAQHGLPAIYATRELVEAGGLMAYGPNYLDMFERAAAFVVKILDGAAPGSLPIDQPRRFRLVVNQQIAQSLGFTVPRGLLARLDEWI